MTAFETPALDSIACTDKAAFSTEQISMKKCKNPSHRSDALAFFQNQSKTKTLQFWGLDECCFIALLMGYRPFVWSAQVAQRPRHIKGLNSTTAQAFYVVMTNKRRD